MALPRVALAPQSSTPFVAPFAAFVGMMALERALDVPPQFGYPIRCAVTLAVILYSARGVISWRCSRPFQSVLIGLAVCLIWVGPDLVFGYRGHWLFTNSLTGEAKSSLPTALRSDWLFLSLRIAGSALLVPVIEELFWRAWMMRWLVERYFWTLPMGACTVASFWTVALLFASEHGPYWEVGLLAGIVYNWWLIRTRSLADCILAHAVTNAVLAAWVIWLGHWQYWL